MPVLHDCLLWLCSCTARKENRERFRSPLCDFPSSLFCPRPVETGALPHISLPKNSISNRSPRSAAHSPAFGFVSFGHTSPARRMARVLLFAERDVAWRPHACFA